MNKSVVAVLTTNALMLVTGVSLGIIIMLQVRVVWGIIWMVLFLVADELLLCRLLRPDRAAAGDLTSLTESLRSALENQSAAIEAEQHQIASLQMMMADPQLDEHLQTAAPHLAELVENLSQIEALLPDMLVQTHARIAEIQNIAARTYQRVQTLSETKS